MATSSTSDHTTSYLAFFSTSGGRFPTRHVDPQHRPPMVVRTDPDADMDKMIKKLRAEWPVQCSSIFANSSQGHNQWHMHWFFDEYDFYTHGGDFLYSLLVKMQKQNEHNIITFIDAWVKNNEEAYPRINFSELTVQTAFHEVDRATYGPEFLAVALRYAKNKYYDAQRQYNDTMRIQLLQATMPPQHYAQQVPMIATQRGPSSTSHERMEANAFVSKEFVPGQPKNVHHGATVRRNQGSEEARYWLGPGSIHHDSRQGPDWQNTVHHNYSQNIHPAAYNNATPHISLAKVANANFVPHVPNAMGFSTGVNLQSNAERSFTRAERGQPPNRSVYRYGKDSSGSRRPSSNSGPDAYTARFHDHPDERDMLLGRYPTNDGSYAVQYASRRASEQMRWPDTSTGVQYDGQTQREVHGRGHSASNKNTLRNRLTVSREYIGDDIQYVRNIVLSYSPGADISMEELYEALSQMVEVDWVSIAPPKPNILQIRGTAQLRSMTAVRKILAIRSFDCKGQRIQVAIPHIYYRGGFEGPEYSPPVYNTPKYTFPPQQASRDDTFGRQPKGRRLSSASLNAGTDAVPVYSPQDARSTLRKDSAFEEYPIGYDRDVVSNTNSVPCGSPNEPLEQSPRKHRRMSARMERIAEDEEALLRSGTHNVSSYVENARTHLNENDGPSNTAPQLTEDHERAGGKMDNQLLPEVSDKKQRESAVVPSVHSETSQRAGRLPHASHQQTATEQDQHRLLSDMTGAPSLDTAPGVQAETSGGETTSIVEQAELIHKTRETPDILPPGVFASSAGPLVESKDSLIVTRPERQLPETSNKVRNDADRSFEPETPQQAPSAPDAPSLPSLRTVFTPPSSEEAHRSIEKRDNHSTDKSLHNEEDISRVSSQTSVQRSTVAGNVGLGLGVDLGSPESADLSIVSDGSAIIVDDDSSISKQTTATTVEPDPMPMASPASSEALQLPDTEIERPKSGQGTKDLEEWKGVYDEILVGLERLTGEEKTTWTRRASALQSDLVGVERKYGENVEKLTVKKPTARKTAVKRHKTLVESQHDKVLGLYAFRGQLERQIALNEQETQKRRKEEAAYPKHNAGGAVLDTRAKRSTQWPSMSYNTGEAQGHLGENRRIFNFYPRAPFRTEISSIDDLISYDRLITLNRPEAEPTMRGGDPPSLIVSGPSGEGQSSGAMEAERAEEEASDRLARNQRFSYAMIAKKPIEPALPKLPSNEKITGKRKQDDKRSTDSAEWRVGEEGDWSRMGGFKKLTEASPD